MGRIARLIWIDEVIWTQFQALHPRQASRVIEDTFRSLINIRIELTDEEGQRIKEEREKLQNQYDDISNTLKEYDLKIRAWESKRMGEIVQENKQHEAGLEIGRSKADAIKASGLLWRNK